MSCFCKQNYLSLLASRFTLTVCLSNKTFYKYTAHCLVCHVCSLRWAYFLHHQFAVIFLWGFWIQTASGWSSYFQFIISQILFKVSEWTLPASYAYLLHQLMTELHTVSLPRLTAATGLLQQHWIDDPHRCARQMSSIYRQHSQTRRTVNILNIEPSSSSQSVSNSLMYNQSSKNLNCISRDIHITYIPKHTRRSA